MTGRTATPHDVGVATENHECGDGHYRDFWRAACTCGWRGWRRFYRSVARQDVEAHREESNA